MECPGVERHEDGETDSVEPERVEPAEESGPGETEGEEGECVEDVADSGVPQDPAELQNRIVVRQAT